MFKKIIAVVLVVALTATISIAGTLAYLQSEDSDVNVMTMGNVKINQFEMERTFDAEGNVTGMQTYTQGQPLFPVVVTQEGLGNEVWAPNPGVDLYYGDYIEGAVGGNGTWQNMNNEMDKFVFVENTGKSDAYYRTIIAYEAETTVKMKNDFNQGMIHFNTNGHANFDWAETYIPDVEINGVKYNIWYVVYKEALKPGEISRPSLLQVGMDQIATNEYVAQFGETYDILVLSQAVQVEGFADAATALNTAFGEVNAENASTWFGGMGKIASADSDEELDAAIEEGAQTIVLGDGNYIIPDSAQGKTLTIIGNGDTVIATQDDGSYEGCDYSLDGATVTFKNITINTDSTTYTGYARLNATYENCTINGSYTLYGNSVFNNCTFNVTGDVYNIWTWGAGKVSFTNCTFNSDGKSILVYNQTCDVTIDNCVFNDKGGLSDLKAAIETGVDGVGPKYNIYVNNTVVNGYEENDKGSIGGTLVGNKNSMTNEYLNVVVDGVDIY